jgi:Rod binding domain-containing protein
MGAPIGAVPHAAVPGGTHAARIDRLAREFEGVFLTNMLEEMFAGLNEGDPFGGGAASATWRSLQTEEFARIIAAAGGIGLADHVRGQLIALQENQS